MNNLRIASLVSIVLVSTLLSPSASVGEDPHTYSSHSANDQEATIANQEPKKPGEKGHWVSKSFRVSCGTDQGLSEETYVRAAVGSQKTDGDDCFGSYLHIYNRSPKYPAYFEVDGRVKGHLEPKQKKVVHLLVDESKDHIRVAVIANLSLKYWDDESGPGKN
jgi:hypothetical protein